MTLLYILYSSQYIIVSSLLKAPQLTLFDHKYPDWSITVGYIIGFSSFMWIPIYMVYKLVWTPGSLKQVKKREENRNLLTARRSKFRLQAWDLSVWGLHVFTVSVWVLSGFSVFLPQSRNMHVRRIGYCKLSVVLTHSFD